MGSSIDLAVYYLMQEHPAVIEDGTVHLMLPGTIIEQSSIAKWWFTDKKLLPGPLHLHLDSRQAQTTVYRGEYRWCSGKDRQSVREATPASMPFRIQLFTHRPSVWPPLRCEMVPVFLPLIQAMAIDTETPRTLIKSVIPQEASRCSSSSCAATWRLLTAA